MIPMVVLGLVAIATALPTELKEGTQLSKENVIPIYKSGYTTYGRNLFGIYNPYERKVDFDVSQQLFPYRYYNKEQLPLAYKPKYSARYIDIDEAENLGVEGYDYPETSYYKQSFEHRQEDPYYYYNKPDFAGPYSPEYLYKTPYNIRSYNPYAYHQQYKHYYGYYPHLRYQQYYNSPLYRQQYYHYYPFFAKQRSLEDVKPIAYKYWMPRNILPHQLPKEAQVETIVSNSWPLERFLINEKPVQTKLVEKVHYIKDDQIADEIVYGKTLVQPISKGIQEQAIVTKPIINELPAVERSLSYDQDTTYYRPLSNGQKSAIPFPAVQTASDVSLDQQQSYVDYYHQPLTRKFEYGPSKNHISYYNQPSQSFNYGKYPGDFLVQKDQLFENDEFGQGYGYQKSLV